MKTSFYLPDDLYAAIKDSGGNVSQIARQACEAWLNSHDLGTFPSDPNVALGMIEEGARRMRRYLKAAS